MKRSVEAVRAEIHEDLDRWWGEEYDRLKEMLDDLLHAHAHELAEKIRGYADTVDPCLYANVAADFIDPEAAG
ncbi:hypothetical protein [Kitasatospora sp. NPDC101183]|uniref:hypothetical protein n=1 Tax=Kitasatospora sp. NPDC101183 TaxID=3364100 RepID=UPI003806F143